MSAATTMSNFVASRPNLTGPLYWLGAASFEERCLGSARVLAEFGGSLEAGLIVDYATKIEPGGAGQELRAKYRKALFDSLPARDLPLQAYRFGPMIGALESIERSWGGNRATTLVVDATCFTKIHSVALGYWLATQRCVKDVLVAYTRPIEYGTEVTNVQARGRWVETIVAPLGFDPQLTSGETTGLLLLGHEGSRLRLAVDALEPDGGLAILAGAEDSALTRISEWKNGWLLGQAAEDGIDLETVDFFSAQAMRKSVSGVAAQARAANARMVIYPFGPKPHVIAASFYAAVLAPRRSWISYPVPKSYSLTYTSGVGLTYWASIRLS